MSSITAGTTSTTTLIHSGDTTGSLVFKTNDTGSGGTTAVTIDTSQNVGIGTSSIATIDSTGKTLEIYGGAGGGFVHMTNSTTGQTVSDGFIIGTSIGGSDALLVQRESANMIFRTADTERMRIDSSGMLGIGTTSSASSRLSISGTATLCMMKNESATSGTAQTTILFRDNGDNTRGSITVSTSGTVYNTTSDYRLKENIAPMTGALAKVDALKPCTYTWKETGDSGQGFIAHELAEVVPECVTGEKDAVETRDGKEFIVPQGIDTSFLVATLTAALQETKALIDQQAETINAQSEAIASLTARVVALEGK